MFQYKLKQKQMIDGGFAIVIVLYFGLHWLHSEPVQQTERWYYSEP